MMKESKFDLLEKEIENISLFLRKILAQVAELKDIEIGDIQNIVVNESVFELQKIISFSNEEFHNFISDYNTEQKEIITKILATVYKKQEHKDIDLKNKILFLLNELDLETKSFSVERANIKESL